MERKQAFKKWLWYFSIVAAAILLFKLYDNFAQAIGLVGTLLSILSPFVGGLVLAFLMYRPSLWIENKLRRCKGKLWPRIARPLALTATYLALIGILFGVVWLLVPALVSGLRELAVEIPNYIAAATQKVQEWDNADGWLAGMNLSATLNDAAVQLAEAVPKLLTVENVLNALKHVGTFASSLLDVAISFIVSLYMLAGREHLIAAFKNLLDLFFKPKTLGWMSHYGNRTLAIFGNYFYGALLDALLVGVVVSIGLSIFGVPFAPLLGMVLGVMNLIPYFGAIIGCVGIALVTLLSTNIYTAVGVAIFLLVIQQVDGNIIQPRLVGYTVGLRPIYVLLSVTLFGGLFGFWGVLLAPPLMAIIQMFVRDATIARKKAAAPAADPADAAAETSEK